MSDFIYSVQATINCNMDASGAYIDHVDVGFHIHKGQPPSFVKEGVFTEAGVDAMLTGYTAGLTGVIHTAGQQSGMDTAALLRRAIGLMEEQFVQQVETTPVETLAYPRKSDNTDGTQPKEVP